MRRIFFTGLILIWITACAKATPQPTLQPAATPTSESTPIPTLPPSPTPVFANIRARDLTVNCRFGPGVVYEIINVLRPAQSANIAGQDSTNTWWQIRDPGNPGNFCWVDKTTVDADANADSVSVVNAPPATITQLQVEVEPSRLVVACDAFPQVFVFKADITVNGPALVTWQWEVSTGEVSPAQTLIFEETGTQSVQEFYRIQSPNDYSVNLHISSPNERSERENFFAQCTP